MFQYIAKINNISPCQGSQYYIDYQIALFCLSVGVVHIPCRVRRVISHHFSHHVVDSLPLPHILGMHRSSSSKREFLVFSFLHSSSIDTCMVRYKSVTVRPFQAEPRDEHCDSIHSVYFPVGKCMNYSLKAPPSPPSSSIILHSFLVILYIANIILGIVSQHFTCIFLLSSSLPFLLSSASHYHHYPTKTSSLPPSSFTFRPICCLHSCASPLFWVSSV